MECSISDIKLWELHEHEIANSMVHDISIISEV